MNLRPIVVPMTVTETKDTIRVGVRDSIQPRSVKNYEELDNLPMINGVPLIGNKTTDDLMILSPTFTHHQNVASDEWTITHNLGKFPSVTVVDSAGTVVIGSVQYIDDFTIVCRFNGVFSGIAYLN